MHRSGQSTLEIIIAVTILMAGIIAAIIAIFGGQSLSLDSQESTIALRIAQREIEKVESQARYDFAAIISSSSTEDEFIKNITVTSLSTSTKEVTVQITWRTDPLRLQELTLVTHITDWQSSAASGGDTGGGGLTGDWNNPRTLGSIDLGPGASATDLDVLNKLVYISSVAAAQSKEDFYIINVEDGQNPYIVSNISTGPGLNGVDVAGNYAYVAQDKTTKQLQVIDITDKANPSLATELTLADVSGVNAIGWSIFYQSEKIYIATKQATGPELHVIDVSSPTAPVEIGSYEVGADVNEIRVVGNTAYLATSDDSAELLVLNVSDPAAISLINSFNPAGSEDGKSVYLVGTKLYLGRETGQSDELRVLDVSNPASIQILGTKNITYDVTGILVRDYLAFITTSAPNEEFQVWNITDPANITKVSGFNFPQVANGIDYEDNLVYVAVRSNDALRIITSQ
ncbi:MAG: hypothetical protein AAB897_03205 [Patescibacteria group bacterium]